MERTVCTKKTWTEEWHEKFMTSLSELTVVEYYLDILLFGDRADKEALVKRKMEGGGAD